MFKMIDHNKKSKHIVCRTSILLSFEMKLYIDSQYDCLFLEAIYFLNVFVCKLLGYSLFRRFKGKYQMTEYTHIALFATCFFYRFVVIACKKTIENL